WLHIAESNSAVATCNDEAILIGGEYLARRPGHVENASRSEKLEIGPAVGRPGAGLGVVGAYHVGNLVLAERPVDASSVSIHFGRVSRQRIVLSMLCYVAQLDQCECLDQGERAEFGQAALQLSVCLVIGYRRARLENDRSGIEGGHHPHYGDTSLGQPLTDRALNWRCAAEGWQQRRVNVERAVFGRVDYGSRQDVAIGDDDGKIRGDRLDELAEVFVARRLGLEDGERLLECDPLDRGLREHTIASHGPVRTSNDG